MFDFDSIRIALLLSLPLVHVLVLVVVLAVRDCGGRLTLLLRWPDLGEKCLLRLFGCGWLDGERDVASGRAGETSMEKVDVASSRVARLLVRVLVKLRDPN